MKWLKVTIEDRFLLADDYPRLDFCEIADEKVVRRIRIWKDGSASKQTVQSPGALRARGLRDTVPELSWNKPGAEFLVEEIRREEFEEAWAKATPVGDRR